LSAETTNRKAEVAMCKHEFSHRGPIKSYLCLDG